MNNRNKSANPELRPGEEVVWTGCPSEEKFYGRADRVLVPLSLLALMLSALYAVLMVTSIAWRGFSMHHVIEFILLLIGGGFSVYCYFVRFSTKRQMKADLIYGVTSDGRVFIRDQGARRLYAFEGDQLKDAWISEVDRHGVGTIYLGRRTFANLLDNTGMDLFSPDAGMHEALYDIPDCKKVYKLIKRAR